jgi:succinate dehydrogenase / fumarate reductase flavoprotein subunit
MTRNVTVVRNNADLQSSVEKIAELQERYGKIGMSDRSGWTNQEVVFARALGDMLIMARVIAEGALLRNECRGVQYKPEFDIPAPKSDDPAELQAEAEQWCRAFAKKNEKWLKTTVAEYSPDGPKFSYEEVDTSLIPPRPRTYGMKGAEVVTETWKKMTESGEVAAQPAGANAGT